ncbi:MAG: adenylate kinase [Clostridia bacterium]|nr:adenylate kinase [Clostridia bacterium]
MNIIMLGAPGAGKGTQAENICEKYNLPAISTGNIIRAALKSGSEAGKRLREYTDAGKLVPDEVVIDIVRDRIAQPDCANGFVLDGFPRTIPQAEALDAMGVQIDKVIEIDVPDEKIVARMSGRRTCACGASYHLEYKKPKVDGICNYCGGTLGQRKDDLPETVLERLRVYHEQTEPLKDYYAKQGKLRTVVGQEEVADTTRLTFAAVEGA